MVLSADQLKALGQGEAISVTIDDKDCVVVQKDVFERMKSHFYDDPEMDPRQTYSAVLKAIDKDDEDPDQYLDYLQES